MYMKIKNNIERQINKEGIVIAFTLILLNIAMWKELI